MNTITILLADDHRLVREILKAFIETEPRCKIIAEASCRIGLLRALQLNSPDIILLDLHMPSVNGISTIKEICHHYPETKIIGMDNECVTDFAKRVLKAGAKGYITKDSTTRELLTALIAVSNGQDFACRELKEKRFRENLPGRERPGKNIRFTPREKQIVQLIIDGFSSREIAEQLSIIDRTVEIHRYNILKKLNLQSTVALVNYVNMYGAE